jgi:hypothetical protein
MRLGCRIGLPYPSMLMPRPSLRPLQKLSRIRAPTVILGLPVHRLSVFPKTPTALPLKKLPNMLRRFLSLVVPASLYRKTHMWGECGAPSIQPLNGLPFTAAPFISSVPRSRSQTKESRRTPWHPDRSQLIEFEAPLSPRGSPLPPWSTLSSRL